MSTRSIAFVTRELAAKVIHGPELGERFAPGYYSILFEDPDGIRVEFNYMPGSGHFGKGADVWGRVGLGLGQRVMVMTAFTDD